VKSNSCVASDSFVIVAFVTVGCESNRTYTCACEMNIPICEIICEVLRVSCS
jgi:hypothetical protein